jgi:amino acid adenylation domain-containing protein
VSIAGLLERLSEQGIQLWFEGNRLRFRGPRGALGPEDRAALAEHRDEAIAVLRERAAAGLRSAPLSYGQRSLWFVNQEEPDSAAYNVAFSVAIASEVDRSALEDSIQALIDRHAILRTTYDIVDGRPSQQVAGVGTAAFEVCETPGLDDARLRTKIEADYKRPFDLKHGPVIRATLYSRGAADHVLLITAHHIAIDGWSLLLLIEELRALYLEATTGTPAALQRPEQEYTDFTDWQGEMLAGDAGEKLARYWQSRLAAPRAEVEVPSDRPRPARKSIRGATFSFKLDVTLSQRLGQLARDEGTTLFVFLLAAFKTLLFRYSGTEDIVVGTPTLGRTRPEFGRTLGHFVNPVPLRSCLAPQMTFRELTASLRQTLIDALEGQEYPLALMVERLQPLRDPSRSPLFETMFVLQRFEHFRELINPADQGTDDTLADFAGLKVRAYDLNQQEGQFDLVLQMFERHGTLQGEFRYSTDLFDESTIRRMADQYRVLLSSVSKEPASTLGTVAILPPEERQWLLRGVNETDAAYPAQILPRLFEHRAAQFPERIAIQHARSSLTYGELNRRANRLARRLRDLGIGPGSMVGICLPRSTDLLVALLGVQKSGGAYVPLDPGFPAGRQLYMLTDSGARVLITADGATAGVEVPSDVKVLDLKMESEVLDGLSDANLTDVASPQDPAYVLYTSGSTGRPKGVVVPHGALVNLLSSMEREPGLQETDVFAAVTTISFDIAAVELYLPLLVGARIELVSRDTAMDGRALAAQLGACGATVLQATPVTWRLLIEAGWRGAPALRAFCGGEPLSRELADAVLERATELWNLYGPTETTVYSTLARIERGSGPVPIGRPLANTQIYVLDAERQPVPIGVPGEIWIAGAGLALGYHGCPELTNERFVRDDFSDRPDARMYRTGDVGRWAADGQLHHLGRLDHQVKIRGFRIELGEVESVLCQHPEVREAIVVVRTTNPDDPRLVAHMVPSAVAPAAADLREHLRKQLPEYMVPGEFAFIDKLPLTANGKVDRKALAAASAREPSTELSVAPVTETEKEVARLFAEVLNVPTVDANRSFFELGGHSLLAAQALARLRDRFDIEIPLIALFQAPTVQGFSRWLDLAREESGSSAELTSARTGQLPAWKCLVPAQSNGTNPPLFLVTGYMDADDTLRILSNLIPHLGPDQPLCGLRPRWLDGHSPQYSSVAEMTAEYVTELRSFQPRGPYYLLGDCVGGVVAIEMAQKLIEEGDEVALLVLLDTERPRSFSLIADEAVRLWDWRKRVREVFREFLHPSGGTRRQLLADLVRRKLRRARLSNQPPTTIDYILAQRKAYRRLLKRHRLRRYPGRIKLILSEDLYRVVRLLGWDGFADGGVEVFRTPGDHPTFRAQYSRELGQQVRLCIDQARSKNQGQPVDPRGAHRDGLDVTDSRESGDARHPVAVSATLRIFGWAIWLEILSQVA